MVLISFPVLGSFSHYCAVISPYNLMLIFASARQYIHLAWLLAFSMVSTPLNLFLAPPEFLDHDRLLFLAVMINPTAHASGLNSGSATGQAL